MLKLIIVESPTKAKHIGKILSRDYVVLPTMGHIKDLPSRELGIDVTNNFQPHWVLNRGKAEIVKRIKEIAYTADQVIVATDPDREGEGIAYHIYGLFPEILQKKIKRAEFREITETGVKSGLQNLRDLDINMATAQQTRRVVDRLIGFEISPMLWKELKGYQGLSAGRVQSAALQLLYDRNVEIENFVQEEYWTLTGIFQNGSEEEFTTVLTHLDNVSLEERPIRTKEKANKVHELLQSMKFFVSGVEKAEKEYSPPAPFITTTLLQGASTVLGYSSKQTMQVAQELFEGISIDGQSLGLITYMRTDSTRVSHESQEEARHFIAKRFGKQYVSQIETAVQLSNGIQDAHECIRPTSMSITPQDIKNDLTKDQLGIYTLIFNRFMMSQMAAARHLEVTVKIRGGHKKKQALFHGFSSQILFDGWRIVVKKGEVNKQPGLEALQEGEEIMAKDFLPQQHFTRALPHYSESVLIKTLEKLGIGRPSTYSTIIDTLKNKQYVQEEKRQLIITEIGQRVVDALVRLFPLILSSQFTATMEKELDQVANGEGVGQTVVSNLYQQIEVAKRENRKLKGSYRFTGKKRFLDWLAKSVTRYIRKGTS